MVNLSLPPSLKNGSDLVEEWKMFQSMHDYYSVIVQVDKQPQEYQFTLLMHTKGPKGIQLYKVLPFDDGEDEKDELNVVYEWYQFNNRCQ